MLVTYKDSRFPVGIAITQWKIDGYLRTFILYPIHLDNRNYVEIDVVIEEICQLTIVTPQTAAWQKLNNGFGDDSYGYPVDEHARSLISLVWEYGAWGRKREAEELYDSYKALIDLYTPDARKYFEQVSDEYFRDAEKKGWETSLIEKQRHDFPYGTRFS